MVYNSEKQFILLLSFTLLISSLLLFWIQPLYGKTILPLFGGTPAVWNTCMVFFQSTLFLGYLYSFVISSRFTFGKQIIIHSLMLLSSLIVFPIGLSPEWTPNQQSSAMFQLIMVLITHLGIPVLILSTTAPLMQYWLHLTKWQSGKDPYFLYSASNLGCLGILMLYPFAIEPLFGISTQFWAWNAGYIIILSLIMLSSGCAWLLRNHEHSTKPPMEQADPVRWFNHRAHWLILSLIPSAYLYSVTQYITTDLAAAPLLWVIPLALYLLTFVIAFAKKSIISLKMVCQFQPALILPVILSVIWNPAHLFIILYPLHIIAFFVSVLMCHQCLAQIRPPASQVTEFYLWIAFGGVIGGLFSTLVAPWMFTTMIEYPLLLTAVTLLRPGYQPRTSNRTQKWNDALIPGMVALILPAILLLFQPYTEPANQLTLAFIFVGVCAIALKFRNRPLRFGLMVGALAIVSILTSGGLKHVLFQDRNFFGTIRVSDDPIRNIRTLVHGNTTHGVQHLDSTRELEPLTYYYNGSPISQVFQTLMPDQPLHVGIMGLGTGTLLLFGDTDDQFTFYEIDPTIEQVAKDPALFTYFTKTKPDAQVILGDARISLRHEQDHHFDLLIMDAFSSDSIPIHLITQEAFSLYLEKIKETGTIAVHISNQYIDLEPVLAGIAQEFNLNAYVRDDNPEGNPNKTLKYPTKWVVLSKKSHHLAELLSDPEWKSISLNTQPILWTDDYSNLLSVIKFNGWKTN